MAEVANFTLLNPSSITKDHETYLTKFVLSACYHVKGIQLVICNDTEPVLMCPWCRSYIVRPGKRINVCHKCTKNLMTVIFEW